MAAITICSDFVAPPNIYRVNENPREEKHCNSPSWDSKYNMRVYKITCELCPILFFLGNINIIILRSWGIEWGYYKTKIKLDYVVSWISSPHPGTSDCDVTWRMDSASVIWGSWDGDILLIIQVALNIITRVHLTGRQRGIWQKQERWCNDKGKRALKISLMVLKIEEGAHRCANKGPKFPTKVHLV